MSTRRFVVVGAGLAGAATAWQLARRGHEVTVLERTTPANAQGSSHGSARIFRYAYPDPFYTQLVTRARAGWDELERLTGQRLITPTGAVDFGAARDPEGLAVVLAEAGVEHELLDAAEATARWPQLAFETDVLWHPGAGVIDAHSSVAAMLRLAQAEGAEVLTDWPVARVEEARGGYRVVAADGRTARADHVVVAAGGWLPDLLAALPLPDRFRAAFPRLVVMQEQAYHFPYREEAAAAAVWPTFIHKTPGIQVYGLPGGRDAGSAGQKVAEFNGGTPLRSAAEQDGVLRAANRARVVDYVARTLPGVVPEPYAETTCLFTNTPTEDFVIDGPAGLTVLSPCSGHGGKFAPLLGELAARAALGEQRAPEPFLVAA